MLRTAMPTIEYPNTSPTSRQYSAVNPRLSSAITKNGWYRPPRKHQNHAQVVARYAHRQSDVVLMVPLLLNAIRRDQVLRQPCDGEDDHAHDHVHEAARYLLEHVYE